MEGFVLLTCVIIICHWIGDWVCQTDWMATNKSKSIDALIVHSYVVFIVALSPPTLLACWLAPATIASWSPALWLVGNGLLHFLTDGLTSQLTSKWFFFKPYGESNMWRFVPENRHKFFVAIGFDQMVHYLTLILTAFWLLT